MRTLRLALTVLYAASVLSACRSNSSPPRAAAAPGNHQHLDHSPFFPDPIDDPHEVTRACLKCHPNAATEVMATSHWQWLGDPVEIEGHEGLHRIGKKNLINNFCIGIAGNHESCSKCHPGYGWLDDSFDFDNPENVDCLACHDWSGTYAKGRGGLPAPGVDLAVVARSVGYPKRNNCGICHNYGGGGLGVKHGVLDSALDNPDELVDVHMGRIGMVCIDCHGKDGHNIKGRAMSVSVEQSNGISCTNCHPAQPHSDMRLNQHVSSVACQACHIPAFARENPTKTYWDWSKAGDESRPDDSHYYLKKKGAFVYSQHVVPEYRWYNGRNKRYLAGDRIADSGPTVINEPLGSIDDPDARIWPFKVHRGKQPADKVLRHLLSPVTAGEGGYWHEFDWHKAFLLGTALTGIEYSGEYEFVETEMFWPLSHMTAPTRKATQCYDCHGADSRMDWQALGYEGDPMETGGRGKK